MGQVIRDRIFPTWLVIFGVRENFWHVRRFLLHVQAHLPNLCCSCLLLHPRPHHCPAQSRLGSAMKNLWPKSSWRGLAEYKSNALSFWHCPDFWANKNIQPAQDLRKEIEGESCKECQETNPQKWVYNQPKKMLRTCHFGRIKKQLSTSWNPQNPAGWPTARSCLRFPWTLLVIYASPWPIRPGSCLPMADGFVYFDVGNDLKKTRNWPLLVSLVVFHLCFAHVFVCKWWLL